MLSASVIGCGFGGCLSLDALDTSPDYEIRAFADPAVSTLEAAARRFPVAQPFKSYREMLAAFPTDVVCIATPAPTHAAIAGDALQGRRRGLLIEKPLDCDMAAANALVQAVKDAAIPAVVPHGMLVLPAAQEVRARIRAGDVGRIKSVLVQNSVDLLNGGIHWLVYLLDVFDGDQVTGITATFETSEKVESDGVQVESAGTTKLTFRSGLTVELRSGRNTKPRSDLLPKAEQRGGLFRFVGAAGVIELSAWAGSYWIEREGPGELVRKPVEDAKTYHRIFVDQLARDIARGAPDYRSIDLSLAASGLIVNAYGQGTDAAWRLGAPARQHVLGK